jgi:prepilin-type N-terminal cleavage/methylation domain-containing protein
MMIKMNKKGFTLVEIMIVVAIIGLLAAIAIPNFIKAREKAQTNACIANLKQLQGAAQVWAIDTGQASDATATKAALEPDYIKKWPQEGVANVLTDYASFAINADPVCAAGNADHTI